MNNDFSLLFTAHNGGRLAPACVAALDVAIADKVYGRVAALAEMLVILRDDDVLTEVGQLLANHVYRVIGRELAIKAINELAE